MNPYRRKKKSGVKLTTFVFYVLVALAVVFGALEFIDPGHSALLRGMDSAKKLSEHMKGGKGKVDAKLGWAALMGKGGKVQPPANAAAPRATAAAAPIIPASPGNAATHSPTAQPTMSVPAAVVVPATEAPAVAATAAAATAAVAWVAAKVAAA